MTSEESTKDKTKQKNSNETKKDPKDDTTKPSEKKEVEESAMVIAGRRLDRLLGGDGGSNPSSTATSACATASSSSLSTPEPTSSPTSATTSNTNPSVNASPPTAPPPGDPARVTRRWLGMFSYTKSGSLAEVIDTAEKLLDPIGPCGDGDAGGGGGGRRMILNLKSCLPKTTNSNCNDNGDAMEEEETTSSAVDMEVDPSSETNKNTKLYLRKATREIEAWLLSLAIRALLSQSASESSSVSSSLVETALCLSRDAVSLVGQRVEYALAAPIVSSSSRVSTGGNASRASSSSGVCVVRGAATGGLPPLLARLYRYRSLCVERAALVSTGSATGKDSINIIGNDLPAAHRTACLSRDVDGQAMILNLMLREMLEANQVEQAQKLIANSTFPDKASNNQLCRYLYYSGRIQALRLEYTSAHSNLSQCLRKAPTNTGLGFRIATRRLLVVVQLLMGEVPERSVFLSDGMTVELGPYMIIAQAVRRGDLAVFRSAVSSMRDRLTADGTYALISRLAHSVVKAGLRRLGMSYSRISLDDVATRLGLSDASNAEFVVAKAVRDGVIDATIHRDAKGEGGVGTGYVQTHDLVDVYSTAEPAEAFHRRIAYCLTMHNDAVKGMRYPPDAYKKQLEASRGIGGRKGEDKTDEEKAQELEEEYDDDY